MKNPNPETYERHNESPLDLSGRESAPRTIAPFLVQPTIEELEALKNAVNFYSVDEDPRSSGMYYTLNDLADKLHADEHCLGDDTHNQNPANDKHTIWIVWGEDPSDQTPDRYDFDTKAELDAYLKGVEDSRGWEDYNCFQTEEEAQAHIDEADDEDDWQEFTKKYTLVKNHLDDNASGDGFMFETYGAEVEFVKSQPQDRIWTLVEGGRAGIICAGWHFVNRLGYFITEQAFADENESYRN